MRIEFLFKCFEDNFVVFNRHGNIKDVDTFFKVEKYPLKNGGGDEVLFEVVPMYCLLY